MADPIFAVTDVREGINNSDTPTLISDRQVVDARNVDSRDGSLGAKRRGTAAISMTSAAFNSAVIALIRHTPTNLVANDELWGIDVNGNIDRRVAGVWQGGVPRVNDFVVISAANYDANGVSLHGKLFLAALGTQNRLPVWDGTVLRWAGIAQPSPPTVANTAVAGSYTGARFFRIRYTAQSGGVTLRRSEPSTHVAITPSGAFNGVVVTKPTGTEVSTSVACEGQTHWEVEASEDNTLFYRIATVAIGTATYTDTTATGGYPAFTLSESIGEYVPPGSARHVAVDEDRIIFAGSHVYPALDSTVWWTPVSADDGVGNDERIPTETLQYINFDGLDGGAVTSVVGGISGYIFVFKRGRVHKMGRTGSLRAAYDPDTVSMTRGCLPRGAVGGTDQTGVPCVYFLDPNVGLCRSGQRGIEDRLGDPIRVTWRTRNKKATIHPRIIYYSDLEQVWYSVPTAAATVPDLLFMYESRYGGNWFHNGLPATARAMCLFPNATTDTLMPVLGTALTASSYIHEADTGTQDSGTSYLAYVKTKPYALGQLWQKFGLMAAVVLARASSSTLYVKLIRNFGIETIEKSVSLAASASAEERVIKTLDNASMAELNVVQLQYGDGSSASAQAWSVDQFSTRIRSEDMSA
jgi:hypothetical protein